MCESKGLTKPEGEVKARLWRGSYGEPAGLAAARFGASPAWLLAELILFSRLILGAGASSGLTYNTGDARARLACVRVWLCCEHRGACML